MAKTASQPRPIPRPVIEEKVEETKVEQSPMMEQYTKVLKSKQTAPDAPVVKENIDVDRYTSALKTTPSSRVVVEQDLQNTTASMADLKNICWWMRLELGSSSFVRAAIIYGWPKPE